MTDDQQQQIKAFLAQATGGVFATTAAFLTVWKAGLSAERAAQLADFLAKGLRLGISINMPADRWVVQVFMLDPRGETVVLDTVEQSGPLPGVH